MIDAPKALRHRYGKREVRVGWEGAAGPQSATFPLEGLADNTAFLEVLRAHPIDSIHSQETTLEDVFIQVTGRALQ